MKYKLLLIFLLIVTPLFSQEKADGVSGASKKWMPPPSGYTYKIVLIPGIEHYVVQYDENLYRGRTPSVEGLKHLKRYQFKVFFSIVEDRELEKQATGVGLKYIHFPFKNNILSREMFEEFLKLMKENPGPYYFHSLEKSQRLGILAAAYRIHIQGWEYDKTIIEYGRVGGSLKDDDRLLRSIR